MRRNKLGQFASEKKIEGVGVCSNPNCAICEEGFSSKLNEVIDLLNEHEAKLDRLEHYCDFNINRLSSALEEFENRLEALENPKTTPKSNCCGANIVVVGGDEGTNYYKCTKCGKACDIEPEPKEECKYTQEDKICPSWSACYTCGHRMSECVCKQPKGG